MCQYFRYHKFFFGYLKKRINVNSACQDSVYDLESPHDKLGGTYAEGAGHPDKLTVHGWRWYYNYISLFCQMKVEHTAGCFGGAWLKSPLSTEVWHSRHIWRQTAFQFAEVLALNGETYVVSVNKFSATCNWQVVVQVEQNRCKDKALRKAVTLGSPITGIVAHVHPETSISTQQTHQSGKPIWDAFTQRLLSPGLW